MTTITKERLLTIKQWRDTYGPGSNVVLPAEEAEELARIALASLEAEPFGYVSERCMKSKKLGYGGVWEFSYTPLEVGKVTLKLPLYAALPAPVITFEQPQNAQQNIPENIPGGNSPVIPEGWVIVPKKLTAENGAKGVLSGEFSESTFISCPECFGDDDCDTCDGSGRIEIKVPVTWTTIKSIWDKGIAHFAAKPPQEVK
ncbi:hypothetical protein AB9L90_22755 [Escherichia coli]|uniref:hypothetical protein n=1 Tax=Escherichia coli TaxID=562 RepID=UPI0035284D7E